MYVTVSSVFVYICEGILYFTHIQLSSINLISFHYLLFFVVVVVFIMFVCCSNCTIEIYFICFILVDSI